MAVWKPTVPRCEVRCPSHLDNALAEAAAGDTQVVNGRRVRLHGVHESYSDRLHAQVRRGPVQLALEGEPGLRCAVAPLGSARRLVGEDPYALKAVVGDLVGGGLEGTGVVHGDDPVAAVGTPVEE